MATILATFGITISKEAKILDFGCGAGRTVYSLLDQGFVNTVGYDISDYLSLRDPTDRPRFFIAELAGTGRLPFEDNTFDLVISNQVLEHVMDQVGILRELYRVMRPGGCAIHDFPARYSLWEQHSFVPLGGVLAHRWWYKLWALLGIRNKFQKGSSADKVADRNAFFFVESLNYVPNSCYEVVLRTLGYDYKWINSEYYDTSNRPLVRIIGKLNRMLPFIAWLDLTFYSRRLFLRKPITSSG